MLFANFSSCVQRDPFYWNGSEWDHLRFPLIKPYYAISVTGENGFQIHLEGYPPLNKTYYLSVSNVEKIAVEGNTILVYTTHIPKFVDDNSGQRALFWFVIHTDQQIEVGFDQEIDFLTYTQELGIQDPSWRDPYDLLVEYDSTGCLDWIPGCD